MSLLLPMPSHRVLPVLPNPDVPIPLGTVDTKYYGSTGLCLIPDGLVYLDSNRVWLVPYFHAFYYGVLKRLCDLAFPSPGAAAQTQYDQQPLGRVTDVMLNFPDELRTSLASRKLIEERARNLVSVHMYVMIFRVQSVP